MITVDGDKLIVEEQGNRTEHDIGSPEAFAILSRLWLRSGWDARYVYSFTWAGRPIIQLPEDILRIQEVIYDIKPDVIIETGVAHGGMLMFYASLCSIIGKGRVIGIDVEIRPHNREAIETHPLSSFVTLIEGSSIGAEVVQQTRDLLVEDETVMVTLDSNHSRDHVLAELNAYGDMVSTGSYIVAMDGIMQDLVGAPRTEDDWDWNNPQTAVKQFLNERTDFIQQDPAFKFNEGIINERVTYWPKAYLRRISPE